MLSNNHSFRKLNILSKKRSKVDVKPLAKNVSLDDLAFLVKRLSIQVDDLVEENQKKAIDAIPTQIIPSLPQSNHTRENSISKYLNPTQHPLAPPSHTTIDPWASYVPQNYGALLQRLEDIESLQKCPNDCCASTGTVSSADGVPWPQPIEPFRTCSTSNEKNLIDMLDIQYTHWCTLMRCLPLMDPVTCAHVKTVGLYAMREILKCKASHKRERDYHAHCPSPVTTSTRLRESMSCLNLTEKPLIDSIAATHDMPTWMSTSETKTAIEPTGPIPPPKENETTTTPTPSGFPSPHHHSRFQKWVQYKKISRKANTDTSTTPMAQSQTIRKIGSWFF